MTVGDLWESLPPGVQTFFLDTARKQADALAEQALSALDTTLRDTPQ